MEAKDRVKKLSEALKHRELSVLWKANLVRCF
jgi:hypothetical protein